MTVVGMSTIIESEAAFVLDTGMQLYQEIKKTKAGRGSAKVQKSAKNDTHSVCGIFVITDSRSRRCI